MPSIDSGTAIRAVVFDAYGTLFDVFSVTSRCEGLFPGHGGALAQLWRAKQLQYSLLRSLMHRYEDFWTLTADGLTYAAATLGLPLTEEQKAQLVDAYLTLATFPDVTPALTALKEQGLRLAILSNGAPDMLSAAVRNAGIDSLIDRVISVDEVKVFKPDARAYHLAGHALGLASDRLAFVSANSWDVHGAGAAGLSAVWLRRNAGEPEEELGFPARTIVSTLGELPRLWKIAR